MLTPPHRRFDGAGGQPAKSATRSAAPPTGRAVISLCARYPASGPQGAAPGSSPIPPQTGCRIRNSPSDFGIAGNARPRHRRCRIHRFHPCRTSGSKISAPSPASFHLSSELAGLSPQLVRHTCQVHELEEEFRGRRVVVIGAGQSALETAALMHEAGVDVQVIARTKALESNGPNPEHLNALGHIKRPVTQLSEGWRCAFWNTPSAFRGLPESYRITMAKTVLGLLSQPIGRSDALEGHRDQNSATALVSRQIVCKNAE
jgi:Pyridine nucleotide-disulphide oxidoreductase